MVRHGSTLLAVGMSKANGGGPALGLVSFPGHTAIPTCEPAGSTWGDQYGPGKDRIGLGKVTGMARAGGYVGEVGGPVV